MGYWSMKYIILVSVANVDCKCYLDVAIWTNDIYYYKILLLNKQNYCILYTAL